MSGNISLTDYFLRLAFQAAQRDHPELLGALTRDRKAGVEMSEMLRIDRERRAAELRQWQIEQAREFDDTPRSEWPADVTRAWRNHAEELARYEAILDQLAARVDHLRDLARAGGGNVEHGGGRRIDDRGGSNGGNPTFGRARQVIDNAARSGLLPDYAAERATKLVEQGGQGERSLAARWASAAGDQHYANAFAKLVADPLRGHLLWTQREAEAYRVAVAVQGELEERAPMTLTGANGGHMVPLVLDPALMITSARSINPLRQISRVVQTTGSQWSGVTTAGVTAEWKGRRTGCRRRPDAGKAQHPRAVGRRLHPVQLRSRDGRAELPF